MQTENASGTLVRQSLVTALVLALFYFAQRLPVTGIDAQALAESYLPVSVNWMSLGLTPWISGFLLVEIFSLLPGPGRRLRRAGRAGRAKLDRASLILSLACGGVQAIGLTSALEKWVTPGGTPLVSEPGWGFRILFVLTLLAASTALFWLGTMVSRWGLGNGFSLLLLFDLALSILRSVLFRGPHASLSAADIAPELMLREAGPALLFAVLLVVFLRSVEREPAANEDEDGHEAEEDLSPARPRRWAVAFPQSLLAVPLAGTILRLVVGMEGSSSGLFDSFTADPKTGAWLWIGCQFGLVVLLSWPLLRLFSGAKRLAAELPITTEEAARRAGELGRRARVATLLLLAGSAGLAAWAQVESGPWSSYFDIVRLGILIAVSWDVASQWRFTQSHGRTAPLCSLNNVHLAPILVEHLAVAGIPATLQGFRHRALFFSYLPLVRIGVLVPEGRLEEARERMAELELKVI